MTTLISVHNSSGCVGRCDARCYEAKTDKCDCIFGGANHGAGLDRATANTKELAEKWIDKYKADKGEDFNFKIRPEDKQLSLLKP